MASRQLDSCSGDCVDRWLTGGHCGQGGHHDASPLNNQPTAGAVSSTPPQSRYLFVQLVKPLNNILVELSLDLIVITEKVMRLSIHC